MHRNGIRQVPGIGAGLAVAVGNAAVRDGDALDAAGQISRPRHAIGIARADLLNRRQLGFGKVLVPAKFLQHPQGELRVAILDFGVLRVVAVAEQTDFAGSSIGQLFLAFHPEACAEGAPALLDR